MKTIKMVENPCNFLETHDLTRGLLL